MGTRPNGANRMANCVDPYQTCPENSVEPDLEQSDLGLYTACPRPVVDNSMYMSVL